MDKSAQQGLFSDDRAKRDSVVINDHCLVRLEGDHRAVVASGVVVAHFGTGDRMAAAHAMVTLVAQGLAHQNEVAHAFGCSARTLRRHERRFDEGGLAALGRGSGYPRGRPRGRARDRQVARLKGEGLSNRAIAHRLGVDEKSVRKRLRRLGWSAPAPEQLVLLPTHGGADPNLSASVTAKASSTVQAGEIPPPQGAPAADPNLSAFAAIEPATASADTDPSDRRLDRFFAHVGLLDDAAPLFGNATAVPGAGVLLAIPSLVHSGVFAAAREVYGSIGPAFYGLRTTILTLLLMALLRIKRPEALKERSPQGLGRVLGLDRAPEVKTLRRKLLRLAAAQGAAEFGQRLAKHRVALCGQAMGFLYIDGHVRVYHGERRIPKAHVARMRLPMPATTDYWCNDARGDPLFVVTAEANAGLVKMLPELLDQIRAVLGERRLTVVFDRGGFSPRLFARLIAAGFDILTYKKGKHRRVPQRAFADHIGVIDGKKLSYTLADQGVRLLKGALRLRQVTRLKDRHQTPILTSRRDLSALEVAFRMFERWRQENFFKYLREEYLLDALFDYAVEPADPRREVPNPAWAEADAKLRALREELRGLQEDYGFAALSNVERQRPTMRGFKIAHGKIARQLRDLSRRVMALEQRRARLPRRIPVGERDGAQVVKLSTERKHLTNVLKMVAYQAESDLVRLLAPHYKRVEQEGRTLIQAALASSADIEVTDTELRVTLAMQSSAHRSRAAAALCTALDATASVFPGTRLRLRYAVAGPT
ncbi:MAG: putative transposase [Burkholderiales bacterium]